MAREKHLTRRIELAFVVLDKQLQVVDQRQILVRPEKTPLTPVCESITGITWEQLQTACVFKEAVREFDAYIRHEIIGRDLSFCFVTYGSWGLRMQLRREAKDKGIDLPDYIRLCRMFDIKQELQAWHRAHPEVALRSMALSSLCEDFSAVPPPIQPATSVALAMCARITAVTRYLRATAPAAVLTSPIDCAADYNAFVKDESKVIHLSGLPYEITQGELEVWFSSNGLWPQSAYMILASNDRMSVSALALFEHHSDALRALSVLNGRCFGRERVVAVNPSSEHVVEQAHAAGLLAIFPVKSTSQVRPGDWHCLRCAFHNFASRRTCLKCQAPKPFEWTCSQCFGQNHYMAPCMHCGAEYASSLLPTAPAAMANATAPPSSNVRFRPGDWFCSQCHLQNFASRTVCYRCQAPNTNPPSTITMADTPPSYSQQRFRAGDWIWYVIDLLLFFCSAFTYPSFSPVCEVHNFRSRFHCLKCSAPKPEPVKE